MRCRFAASRARTGPSELSAANMALARTCPRQLQSAASHPQARKSAVTRSSPNPIAAIDRDRAAPQSGPNSDFKTASGALVVGAITTCQARRHHATPHRELNVPATACRFPKSHRKSAHEGIQLSTAASRVVVMPFTGAAPNEPLAFSQECHLNPDELYRLRKVVN